MSAENGFFDALARNSAKAVGRRDALRGLAAGLGGAFLALSGARSLGGMPPRTCVVCECGTGRPCNVKLRQCQEVRDFSANVTCQNFCTRSGQRLCGAGSPFHCPQGCSA